MANYKHLKRPINASPGVADLIYIAPVADFDTGGIKGPGPSFVNLEDYTKVVTDHAFKANGEGFFEFLCQPFNNELNADSVGEIGSLGLEPKLTVFIPGNYADLHSTIMKMKNEPLIVLFKDMNCGTGAVTQLGCPSIYTWIESFKYSTGKGKGGGKKGYEVTFTTAAEAILTYTGAILLQDPDFVAGP